MDVLGLIVDLTLTVDGKLMPVSLIYLRSIFGQASRKSSTHFLTSDDFSSLFVVTEVIVVNHVLYYLVLLNLLGT